MSLDSTVLSELQKLEDVFSHQPLTEVAQIDPIEVNDQQVKLKLTLPYPAALYQQALKQQLVDVLSPVLEGRSLDVQVDWQIERQPVNSKAAELAPVKNIIAVASGKGGVGKSTTSVNLALALAAEGAKVGILDADIYGPSQGMMLGVPAGTKPEVESEKFMLPIEAHGIQSMSIAFMIGDNTPMVWRGPMAAGALQQMLMQTKWSDLDYLIVDMPPGTGDIQLTFSQQVPATGAVIVTTPQDIALLDAKKGIEMFRKVNIPVLGVVENMATHICSNCGHEEHIFGQAGGERLAKAYGTRVLGSLPLDIRIREQADGGKPTVLAEPDSDLTKHYRDAALTLAAEIALLNQQSDAVPSIQISDD